MAGQKTDVKAWLYGSAIVAACSLLAAPSNAETNRHGRSQVAGSHVVNAVYHIPAHGGSQHVVNAVAVVHGRVGHTTGRHAFYSRGISCVPYARQVSGISVAGNAWQWWDNAAGLYARGRHPEPGSVLVFRANMRMRLGHVAVVSGVVNPREITIDHANWPTGGGRGGVAHNMAVVDVSEANDWSAVRVELGRGESFGSVYPTNGFIYARPDRGTFEASVHAPAPQPALNRAPRDLRPLAERPWRAYEEVAEAPAAAPHRIDLTPDDGFR